MPIPISIRLNSSSAQIPTRAESEAAGYDLYSDEPATLLPGERRAISTGISLAISPGHYGRIAPRSGLAVKNGIDTLAGVIDASYRGIIKVVLINLGQEPVTLDKGSRIAQLIFKEYKVANFLQVESLDSTVRGEKGFGSSGV